MCIRDRVIRWLDAEGEIDTGSGCDLGVNCSAEGIVKIDRNCKFLRLFGKPIVTYNYIETDYGEADVAVDERKLPEVVSTIDDIAMFVKGKITLPPYLRVDRDMIVKGDLVTKEEVVIRGSVTVYGKTVIGRESCVHGDIFPARLVTVERGATVLGNIFSQSGVYLDDGVRVGKAGGVKSVIGKREIRLAANVCIHGYVLTEGKGMVV